MTFWKKKIKQKIIKNWGQKIFFLPNFFFLSFFNLFFKHHRNCGDIMPGFGTWSKSIIFMVKTFAVYRGSRLDFTAMFGNLWLLQHFLGFSVLHNWFSGFRLKIPDFTKNHKNSILVLTLTLWNIIWLYKDCINILCRVITRLLYFHKKYLTHILKFVGDSRGPEGLGGTRGLGAT